MNNFGGGIFAPAGNCLKKKECYINVLSKER